MEEKKNDPYYKQVADKLIEELQNGTSPFQKKWKGEKVIDQFPMNPISGNRYRGINALNLMLRDRTDNRWMTYKQAQSIGAQVKKGARGTKVQYWKWEEDQPKRDDRGNIITDKNGNFVKERVRLERPQVFTAVVFNGEQIDGLPERDNVVRTQKSQWEAVERAENIIKESGVRIHNDQANRAFYDPSIDEIHMPKKEQFENAADYYGVALHEMAHWTGHSSRLDRDLSNPFGSPGYAKEELRAEIASLMIGQEVDLDIDTSNNAAYVGSWIKALKDDPREILKAAADSEKILNYVLAFDQVHKQKLEQEDNQSQGNGRVEDMENVQATTSSKNRVYIDVPYQDKDEAKNLGARWDRSKKSWYITEKQDADQFKKWIKEDDPNQNKIQNQGSVQPTDDAQISNTTQETVVENEKIYIAVPYQDKDEAKNLGARWDKANKSWYITAEQDSNQFKKWLDTDNKPQQSPSMTPEEEFRQALRDMGLQPTAADPIQDGKGHRIAADGDKKGVKSGSYIYYGDSHPAGHIQNFKAGKSMKWKSKGYSMSPEEVAKLKATAAKNAQKKADERAKQYDEVSQQSTKYVTGLKEPTSEQDYLVKKQIGTAAGLRVNEKNELVIPAQDVNNKIWTYSTVNDKGKLFVANGKKSGSFHVVGAELGKGKEAIAAADTIVIAEGYSTAASVKESIKNDKVAVVSAFDANNLSAVADSIIEAFPDKKYIVAADDDRHLTERNPPLENVGKVKAEKVAQDHNIVMVTPSFDEDFRKQNPKHATDFNDLANTPEGRSRVAATFDIALKKADIRKTKELEQKRIQEQKLVQSKKKVAGISR